MLGECASAIDGHACSVMRVARDLRKSTLHLHASHAGRVWARGGRYFASLPANKLELWFALEAERFQARAPAAHLAHCRIASGDAAPCTAQLRARAPRTANRASGHPASCSHKAPADQMCPAPLHNS